MGPQPPGHCTPPMGGQLQRAHLRVCACAVCEHTAPPTHLLWAAVGASEPQCQGVGAGTPAGKDTTATVRF